MVVFMKRLVIHIGTPKTGSSSLQGIMCKNRVEIMEKNSVLYPFDSDAVGYGIDRMSNGAILQPEYFDDVSLRKKFDDWFSVANTVFLSEEVLFLDDNLRMLQCLRNDKVEIVIVAFFRNAADYLSSLWMEFNRFENRRVAPSLSEFMGGREFLRSLGGLISLIDERPEYSFFCLPYSPKNSPKNSVEEAIRILGVDLSGVQFETYNESMSRVEADIRQLALAEDWFFCENVNSQDIKIIASELSSGDSRPVVETVSDDVIERVCCDHSYFLDHIMKVTGSEGVSFKDIRPSCFGRERQAYQPIHKSEYSKIKIMLKDLGRIM